MRSRSRILSTGPVYLPPGRSRTIALVMSDTLTRRPTFTCAALLLLVAGPLGAQQPQASTGEPWRIVPLTQSTVVYARDGAMLGEIGRQVRTSVSLRTIPRYVPNAFIAVEDKRFYQHNGVDVVGIAGALKDAVTGDVRGASTITQLLVGNMHPDAIDRRDRSPARKLREQKAALEM